MLIEYKNDVKFEIALKIDSFIFLILMGKFVSIFFIEI